MKKYLDWYRIRYRVDYLEKKTVSAVHTLARSKKEARKKFPELKGRIIEVKMLSRH